MEEPPCSVPLQWVIRMGFTTTRSPGGHKVSGPRRGRAGSSLIGRAVMIGGGAGEEPGGGHATRDTFMMQKTPGRVLIFLQSPGPICLGLLLAPCPPLAPKLPDKPRLGPSSHKSPGCGSPRQGVLANIPVAWTFQPHGLCSPLDSSSQKMCPSKGKTLRGCLLKKLWLWRKGYKLSLGSVIHASVL